MIRAAANSAVPASAAAAAPIAGLAGGGQDRGGRRRRRDQGLAGQPAPGRPGPGFPAAAVQHLHQRVVGVARLGAEADPGRGWPHRVNRVPTAPAQFPAVGQQPQSQVGVLTEGAREPLVETAGLGQRGPPVGHVGGDPAGTGQAHGAAFPVGRAPAFRRGHGYPALDTSGAVRQAGQIVGEPLPPVPADAHVVVEERHPGGPGATPASVTRGGRPAPPLATTLTGRPYGRAAGEAFGACRGFPAAARSSTTTTWSGAGPDAAASAARQSPRHGRPTVGMTTE